MRQPISGTKRKAVIDPTNVIKQIEGTEKPRDETPTPAPPKEDRLLTFIEALIAFLKAFLGRSTLFLLLCGPVVGYSQATPIDTMLDANFILPGISAGLEMLNRATKPPAYPIQEAKGKKIMARVGTKLIGSAKDLNEALEKGEITVIQYTLIMRTMFDMTEEDLQLLILEAQAIRANAKKKD